MNQSVSVDPGIEADLERRLLEYAKGRVAQAGLGDIIQGVAAYVYSDNGRYGVRWQVGSRLIRVGGILALHGRSFMDMGVDEF